MVRIFVIEDHTNLIVSSLKYLFRQTRDGISVIDHASSVDETINLSNPEIVDLFLLDLHMPGYYPNDNIRKLKESFPDKPIAIYTEEKAIAWKNRMMREGALTYITKDANREDLKIAIQKAGKGEVFYYGKMEPIDKEGTGEDLSFSRVKITPPQREIVNLLSNGLSHNEISEQTGISRSMIEKILKELRKSFMAKNNNELIKKLTLAGLF
jgi:DNA-binding NarL/FixJ family response regulator